MNPKLVIEILSVYPPKFDFIYLLYNSPIGDKKMIDNHYSWEQVYGLMGCTTKFDKIKVEEL